MQGIECDPSFGWGWGGWTTPPLSVRTPAARDYDSRQEELKRGDVLADLPKKCTKKQKTAESVLENALKR